MECILYWLIQLRRLILHHIINCEHMENRDLQSLIDAHDVAKQGSYLILIFCSYNLGPILRLFTLTVIKNSIRYAVCVPVLTLFSMH